MKNLEVGAKTTWFDGTLRANFTACMMKWEDIKIQVEDPNPLVFSLGIVNFPEAEVDGFEFDVVWLPIRGLDPIGTVAYNDAKISQSASLDLMGFPLDVEEGERLPVMRAIRDTMVVSPPLIMTREQTDELIELVNKMPGFNCKSILNRR